MQRTNWMDFLRQDMRPNGGNSTIFAGKFVDFLRQEQRLKDTPEGLHQHVREVEALIRLHVGKYPVSPDHLIQALSDHYAGSALVSIRSKVRNAYSRFYEKYYENET